MVGFAKRSTGYRPAPSRVLGPAVALNEALSDRMWIRHTEQAADPARYRLLTDRPALPPLGAEVRPWHSGCTLPVQAHGRDSYRPRVAPARRRKSGGRLHETR